VNRRRTVVQRPGRRAVARRRAPAKDHRSPLQSRRVGQRAGVL